MRFRHKHTEVTKPRSDNCEACRNLKYSRVLHHKKNWCWTMLPASATSTIKHQNAVCLSKHQTKKGVRCFSRNFGRKRTWAWWWYLFTQPKTGGSSEALFKKFCGECLSKTLAGWRRECSGLDSVQTKVAKKMWVVIVVHFDRLQPERMRSSSENCEKNMWVCRSEILNPKLVVLSIAFPEQQRSVGMRPVCCLFN